MPQKHHKNWYSRIQIMQQRRIMISKLKLCPICFIFYHRWFCINWPRLILRKGLQLNCNLIVQFWPNNFKILNELFVEVIADISNIEKSRTGEILKEKNERIERMNSQDMDDYVQKGKFFEKSVIVDLSSKQYNLLYILTTVFLWQVQVTPWKNAPTPKRWPRSSTFVETKVYNWLSYSEKDAKVWSIE